MKKKFIAILVSFSIFFFALYSMLPHVLVKYNNKKDFKDLGLEVKKINYGSDHFEYVEGGEGPLILMVHGFQSSKSYWVPYMKRLIKNHRVIALDLPGHGNSSRSKDQKFDIYSLSKSIDTFVKERGLDKFHLMGTSMGGGVVTVYAYDHQEKLNSLTLLNPLGIDRGIKSELQLMLDNGKNVFFPTTLDEFDEMVVFVTGRELALSTYIKRFVLSEMIKNYFFFKNAFAELISSTPLDDILPKIHTKTLILMGQKDRIINPKSFEYFASLMPNAKPYRIKEGSHVLVGESFDEAIDQIEVFIDEN